MCYVTGLPPHDKRMTSSRIYLSPLPTPAGLTPCKLMIPPHMEHALLTFKRIKCYIRGLPPLHKQINSSR